MKSENKGVIKTLIAYKNTVAFLISSIGYIVLSLLSFKSMLFFPKNFQYFILLVFVCISINLFIYIYKREKQLVFFNKKLDRNDEEFLEE
ncbi:hypothetical protein [Psychromonas aquatilis]|uniref:Uncharacterized protein n=1 Tax=Psychromonas aquatilis TaxID=2005072 RepID=A0ABU9GRI1_9GAMM